MIRKSDIFATIEKNSEEIKLLGVKRLAVFGSFSRYTQTKKSDIDILVEFKRGKKTFDNFMDLKHLLQKKLKRRVDLVTKSALKPQLRSAIEKDLSYAGL